MAGDGDHVRAERLCLEGKLEKALHGVGMEQRKGAFPAGRADHFGDGHNGAGFIVDHHDGDEDRVRPQRLRKPFGGDEACFVGLEIGHLEAARLEPLHRMEDGVVLDGGRDDVPSALAETLSRAGNGPVVGLGAAGGEKDALRLRAQCLRDLRAGGLQALFGVDPERVDGRGIAPGAGQQLGHGIDADLRWLRRGGIVQIDHGWAFFHYR